ncbi:MAG: histidine phosphatase family protein [Chloroflexi bacterium]|nr:histidine phosphatase family protein [Chloroflexota bacterium]
MELCLVRHAIAVERGSPGYHDDALRPLTARGRERMREAAAGLRTLFTPELILTSPLVRARETAELLLDVYKMRELHVSDALATGDEDSLLQDLKGFDAGHVIAVGHEPHLSMALSYLLTGDRGAMRAAFKKGAAALVVFENEASPGRGWLEWLAQPGMLRAAGQAAVSR